MARRFDYKPAYCEELINFMAQGYSKTAFAGEIGVSRDTLYNWAEHFPQFAAAMDVGNAKRVGFWERKQVALAETNVGNATSVIFALKNADPNEWRDRREPPVALILPGSITELEIAQRIAALLVEGSEASKPVLQLIDGGKSE